MIALEQITEFDDPSTLLSYGLLGLVAWIGTAFTRRGLADVPASTSPADLASRPEHLAYLAGGRECAVFAALAALRVRRLITGRGVVRSIGSAEHAGSDLQRAVHAAATPSSRRTALPLRRPVAPLLTGIRRQLVGEGHLLSPERRAAIRAVGLVMLGVAAIGYFLARSEHRAGNGDGYLVVLMVVFGIVGVCQVLTARRRARAADRTLRELRDHHAALRPRDRPDWNLYGPEAAAIGAALFGAAAIWASDPAFAGELGLARAASSSGNGSGSSDSSATSCSSGDGGGSSCGGGGGCGSSGGGCGGGGGGG